MNTTWKTHNNTEKKTYRDEISDKTLPKSFRRSHNLCWWTRILSGHERTRKMWFNFRWKTIPHKGAAHTKLHIYNKTKKTTKNNLIKEINFCDNDSLRKLWIERSEWVDGWRWWEEWIYLSNFFLSVMFGVEVVVARDGVDANVSAWLFLYQFLMR